MANFLGHPVVLNAALHHRPTVTCIVGSERFFCGIVFCDCCCVGVATDFPLLYLVIIDRPLRYYN